jgi:branched-chain amino acid transport system substrate-binding protein
MGLANVDLDFIQQAGLEASRAAVFSGIPEAAELPTAGKYVKAYRQRFGEEPGVWGTSAYDKMQLLAGVLEQEGTTRYGRVLNNLLETKGYRGQTGRISIDPLTGNRLKLPIDILRVNRNGLFVVKDQ